MFRKKETGLWFETVGQLVRKCGIEWRGRNDWDWHNDVGFLIGYSPKEREKLIDEAFKEYKNVFGKYPSVVGSWHIDAYSLNYISSKYKIDAACICKEQTGTDARARILRLDVIGVFGQYQQYAVSRVNGAKQN